MPSILIVGCGYVGEAVADLFHRADWAVEGWTGSAESAATLAAKPYPVRAVDISQRDRIGHDRATFDTFVHCASSRGGDAEMYRRLYVNGVRNLLEAFPRARPFFTSSTSVYAQHDRSWVTEESESNPDRETGRMLLEAEKLILAHSGIVTRLAGIHGPGRSALLTKFLNGSAIIDAQFDQFVNQVHRDDIASALYLVINSQSTAGGIYNVVDDQPILQSECYRWLAQRLNRPVPPTGRSSQPPKRGDSNKRVSNAKLRNLGWSAQYPTFADAMEKSILPTFADLIRRS